MPGDFDIDNHMLDYDERDYEDEVFYCQECGEEIEYEDDECEHCHNVNVSREDRKINHMEDEGRYL